MMKKRVLSLFLSLPLLVTSLYGVPVIHAVEEEESAIQTQMETSVTNDLNKLHFYFDVEEYATIDSLTELNEATEYVAQKAETANLTRNVSASAGTDELRLTVCFASDIKETPQYQEFLAERENLDSMEEVRDFRHRLNSYSKAYHEELVSQNMSLLADLEYNEIQTIDYSPYVVMKTVAEDLDTVSLSMLASNESVESICLAGNAILESAVEYTSQAASSSFSTLDEVLKGIGAYETVNAGTYTGRGIRIGIQELGICDSTAYYLSGKSITIDPRYSSYDFIKPHTTNVMSILSVLAPNANYFVSVFDETEIGLGWYIDQRCDIVNCSWGYNNNANGLSGAIFQDYQEGYRLDIDGIYDYQISTHLIVAVKSSGNYNASKNPNNKITSPGYAFNMITVGGVKSTSSGWEHNSNSSYVNTYYPRVKPNIAAPSLIYDSNFYGLEMDKQCSGTSYAAPLVSGCIALLMEKDTTYRKNPQQVLSLINSTATKTADYLADIEAYDSHVGAGIINLQRMLDNSTTHFTFENTISAGSKVIFSKNVDLSYGDEVQIALAWCVGTSEPEDVVNSNGDTVGVVSEINLMDYDIYLVNTEPSDVDMASSTLYFSNVELIRFNVELNGSYRIDVYQNSNSDLIGQTDKLSLSYNLS